MAIKLVKQYDKNGKVLYFKEVDGKKVRISAEMAETILAQHEIKVNPIDWRPDYKPLPDFPIEEARRVIGNYDEAYQHYNEVLSTDEDVKVLRELGEEVRDFFSLYGIDPTSIDQIRELMLASPVEATQEVPSFPQQPTPVQQHQAQAVSTQQQPVSSYFIEQEKHFVVKCTVCLNTCDYTPQLFTPESLLCASRNNEGRIFKSGLLMSTNGNQLILTGDFTYFSYKGLSDQDAFLRYMDDLNINLPNGVEITGGFMDLSFKTIGSNGLTRYYQFKQDGVMQEGWTCKTPPPAGWYPTSPTLKQLQEKVDLVAWCVQMHKLVGTNKQPLLQCTPR